MLQQQQQGKKIKMMDDAVDAASVDRIILCLHLPLIIF